MCKLDLLNSLGNILSYNYCYKITFRNSYENVSGVIIYYLCTMHFDIFREICFYFI